jgi:hypothetical protein
LGHDDVVFSDQFRTMNHYLRGPEARPLSGDPGPLAQSLRALEETGRGGALWIVAPYSARGGHRTSPKLGGFKAWVYDNCRLRNAIGVARLDFRQNELQIYSCPATAPVSVIRASGSLRSSDSSRVPPSVEGSRR